MKVLSELAALPVGFIIVTLVLLVMGMSWWSLHFLRSYLIARSMVDEPNHRTLHQGAIPRGGGIVPIALLTLSFCAMAFWSTRALTFMAFAGLLSGWALLGWWDDKHDLPALPRLLCQLALSLCGVWLLGYVAELQFSHTLVVQLGWFGGLLTVIGVLWFANLTNFMDGMDGLAAGQSIIASITLGFWFQVAGDWELAVCCTILAAACYGFLQYNWHPASLFLGDVGSVSLGAVFGILIVYLNTRHDVPIVCSIILFAVFVTDATVTLFRRLRRGEKIWEPHRSHFYQRLAALGFKHSHIVIAYMGLMVVCSVLASLGVADRDSILPLIGLTFGILGLAMIYVTRLEIRAAQA